MRQLWAFLDKIRVRTLTQEYNRTAILCKFHNAEICSLDEILGVSSDEEDETNFGEQFEKRALALLEERRKAALG